METLIGSLANGTTGIELKPMALIRRLASGVRVQREAEESAGARAAEGVSDPFGL